MLRASVVAAGAVLTCALAATGIQAAPKIPGYVSMAVADKARPESDTQADADRKPAETLAFAGIKPGQQVAELIPGGGYYTRLLSAVVGPKGKVYALPNQRRPDAAADAPDPAARLSPDHLRCALRQRQREPDQGRRHPAAAERGRGVDLAQLP